MKILALPVKAARNFVRMVFRDMSQRWSGWGWGWGSGRTAADADYDRLVGDGTGSSTVMAPLLWIARTFPEAPPALWRQKDDGQEEQERSHALLKLLQRPNSFYTGPILWMATMIDWTVDGNAYWLKLRDRTGTVRELWWAPNWMIEPKGDKNAFVSYYAYSPEGNIGDPIRIRPEDVVHFRFGLDPENDRKGYSPLKSVLREVFTDDEAARFTASLLRNMGVPGLIVSPDANDFTPSTEDVAATKAYLSSAFSGDKRGEPLVMSGPTKVAQFGFSPEQLMLRELRRIPEERVTAVLGVPAIVAGLGAGLDRSTFTNMGEAREAAYESGIIPTQRIIAEDVRFQLLSEFETDVFEWRFGFDLAKVRVLQTDEDALLRRMDVAIRGGWARVGEGRRVIGLPVGDGDDVYLRQVNTVEVDASTANGEIRPMTGPVTNGNGNGNGHAADTEAVVEEVIRRIERDRAAA